MIEISFATNVFIVMLGWILVKSFCCAKNGTINLQYEAVQLLFLINLIVIVRFTFHPFSKVDGQIQPLIFDAATAFPFRVNLIPFVTMFDYDGSIRDILINIPGNIAMFIPTGIMLPLIYKNMDSMKKVVLTGLLISLCIEIIQLPFSVRASDIDDLILNTIGCLIGWSITALVRRMCRSVRTKQL